MDLDLDLFILVDYDHWNMWAIIGVFYIYIVMTSPFASLEGKVHVALFAFHGGKVPC